MRLIMPPSLPLVKQNTNFILDTIINYIESSPDEIRILIDKHIPNYKNIRVRVNPIDGSHEIMLFNWATIICSNKGLVTMTLTEARPSGVITKPDQSKQIPDVKFKYKIDTFINEVIKEIQVI